jgi:hypothetical protein
MAMLTKRQWEKYFDNLFTLMPTDHHLMVAGMCRAMASFDRQQSHKESQDNFEVIGPARSYVAPRFNGPGR